MADFTYDLTDNVGKVRLKIQDKVESGRLFDDAEIQVALDETGSDTNLAAARCLRWVAASKALLAKAVKIGNWSKDEKALTDALLKAAAAFEKTAASTPATAFASQDLTDAQYKERLGIEALTTEQET